MFSDLFNKISRQDTDINEQAEACRNTPGAVLIDVREVNEFAAGHIPGAVNVPLSAIQKNILPEYPKETPLYIYCLRGSRSRRAAEILTGAGFTEVYSIGGINQYKGSLETGSAD